MTNQDLVIMFDPKLLTGYMEARQILTRRKVKRFVETMFQISEAKYYTIIKTGVCTYPTFKRLCENTEFKQYLQDQGMLVDITEMF